MSAAEELAVGLHAVADHPGAAVGTGRGDFADRAFEAVEDVVLALIFDQERFVVVVPADFATHRDLLGVV